MADLSDSLPAEPSLTAKVEHRLPIYEHAFFRTKHNAYLDILAQY